MGQYNLAGSTISGNSKRFDSKNKAFVIGNGNSETPSDAFSIDFEGNIDVYGTLDLKKSSEIRFKDEFGKPQRLKLSDILNVIEILYV